MAARDVVGTSPCERSVHSDSWGFGELSRGRISFRNWSRTRGRQGSVGSRYPHTARWPATRWPPLLGHRRASSSPSWLVVSAMPLTRLAVPPSLSVACLRLPSVAALFSVCGDVVVPHLPCRVAAPLRTRPPPAACCCPT